MKYTILVASVAGLGMSGLRAQQTAASIPVDLELSLVIDISGSVDPTEFTTQLGGYASAFQNPQIIQSIESIGQVVVNAVFFDDSASEALPFALLTDAASSTSFADDLGNLARPRSGGTSPDTGINLATNLLAGNVYEGERVVIDVSGDGQGFAPDDSAARDNALANGVDTINGVVIDSPRSDPSTPTPLEQYFLDNIVAGDNSFVILSEGFESFEDAVLAKLLAEITGVTPAQLGGNSLLPGLFNAQSLAVATSFSDVNSRLVRLRTGIRPQPISIESAPVFDNSSSAKGGLSSKGGLSKTPIASDPSYRQPFQVFGSIGYTTANYDAQSFSNSATSFLTNVPSYDIDIWSASAGLEYAFNQNLSLGAALVGTRGEIDFDDGSDVDTNSYGISIYGSYYRPINLAGVETAFYADLLYGVSFGDFDSDRVSGLGTASGDTDSLSHLIQFNTGLNFQNAGITHGPIAGIAFEDGTIDSYNETGSGALSIPEISYQSLKTTVGYQASYRIETSAGAVIPQLRGAWEHEFRDDEVSASGIPLGQPASNIGIGGVGVLWQFAPNMFATLDYEARYADEFDSHSVWLRVGASF